jgi:hypothetical protein
MQEKFFTQLRRAISHERLDAYTQRGARGDGANLFAHYAWNVALSESLYPTLQCLEVCLRNSIHDAASAHFRTELWFDRHGLLFTSEMAKIDEARGMLTSRKKSLDPGRIIAELNFGFWTSLFDVRYEQKIWPWLLKGVVPHMPRSIRTRKTLSKRLNRIRFLRNRIFHHEPIWHWRDLSTQHGEVLETIAWINPAMQIFARSLNRFPEVFGKGVAEYLDIVSSLETTGPCP